MNHVERAGPGKSTKEVERRSVDLVLTTERVLGRDPEEQAFTSPGYDVLATPHDGGPSIHIEVEARLEGADDFYVTHNEVVTAQNAAPDYRLALVIVSRKGPTHGQVRYVSASFDSTDFGALAVTDLRADWHRTWAVATSPF